jgi:CBS domain-containing protein
MASNLIVQRVATFLSENPPFGFLKTEHLQEVAENTSIRYVEEGFMLFNEGEAGKNEFYVLKEGSVELLTTEDQLVDHCEPGDVFGVRSILSGKPYVMSARSNAECLLYVIPSAFLLKMVKENDQVAAFFTSGLASGQAVLRGDQRTSKSFEVFSLAESTYLSTLKSSQTINYQKMVLTCQKETSIQEAAALMSGRRVGSIVITDDKAYPLGILTDTDLREKVVARNTPLSVAVESVMSCPVRTINAGITLHELILQMIESGYHHLVVTDDGTDKSKVVGIVSDHDVMLNQGNHPAAIMKSIEKAVKVSELVHARDKAEVLLKDYLENNISVQLISTFISGVNDRLVAKAIALAWKDAIHESPELEKVKFCWFNFGSEGRKEQLLRTDLDNGLVYEDSDNSDDHQAMFLAFTERVIDILVACGFKPCPAEMMANNPRWCQPLSRWKKYFSDWIRSPGPQEVMHTTIFLDFRRISGDISLIEEMDQHIMNEIDAFPMYLNHLAKNAVSNSPPIGFFNNLLVEKSGKHKDEFDIKGRAMMPLTDAARVLCLHQKVSNKKNTRERFNLLQELDPKNKNVYEEAIMAYESFLKMRAFEGLRSNSSGRYIQVDRLNKLEKKILRNSFLPIDDVQKILETRFQLAYFN